MKHFARRCLSAALLLCASLFMCSVDAHADSYQFVSLDSSSGSINILGITSTGTVVTVNLSCDADQPGSLCYTSYSAGSAGVGSHSDPGFAFDSGTACSPVLGAGFASGAQAARCNGAQSVFVASTDANPMGGIFDGSDASEDQIFGGPVGGPLVVNSEGDIAFDSLVTGVDVDMLGIDLTSRTAITGEPATFALLCTGLLAIMAIRMRRSPLQ